jgi:putative membrane protein
VTASPPAPRFELEDKPMARLDPPAAEAAPPEQTSTGFLVASGVAVLGAGLAVLGAGNFVADEFARAAWLGWASLAVVGAGFGLLGAAIWREFSGLAALGAVDRISDALASGEPRRIDRAARAWAKALPGGAGLLAEVTALNDPDAVLALLRARTAELQRQARAIGLQAAWQVAALTAAVPSPALDALVVGWRGIRLVRQVAGLYGLRPGIVGTLALVRRTALSAAGVAAANIAGDTLARAAFSNDLVQRLAGDVAGAGVAARRMVVLARAAARACSPL